MAYSAPAGTVQAGGLLPDATTILSQWYNGLKAAERKALQAVGLGTWSTFLNWARQRTIEDPRFLLDLAQAVVTNQDVIGPIVRQLGSQTQTIPQQPAQLPPASNLINQYGGGGGTSGVQASLPGKRIQTLPSPPAKISTAGVAEPPAGAVWQQLSVQQKRQWLIDRISGPGNAGVPVNERASTIGRIRQGSEKYLGNIYDLWVRQGRIPEIRAVGTRATRPAETTTFTGTSRDALEQALSRGIAQSSLPEIEKRNLQERILGNSEKALRSRHDLFVRKGQIQPQPEFN